MSGIVGIFNHDFAYDLALEGLKTIERRGLDLSKIYSTNRSALGEVTRSGDVIVAEDRSSAGYARVRWEADEVTIERDVIGVKPLFYSLSHGFAFASERKALLQLGFTGIFELNPREVVSYNIIADKVTRDNRKFFPELKELQKARNEIRDELKALILRSVKSKIPDRDFGLLLSGGLDSTLIACCIKQYTLPDRFTCYCAGMKGSKDISFAKNAARVHGLNLKVIAVGMGDLACYVEEVVGLIEDSSAMKVGVGLPLLIAIREAKKDGIEEIFVGNGADELFGGYSRHKASCDINKDCFSDMLSYYERNGYRDDVIGSNEGIEFIMPFLDPAIIEYALQIPPSLKIDQDVHKVILRDVAVDIGVGRSFAYRKKTAAQYGSGFDRAIERLARSRGFKSKRQYLKGLLGRENLRLGVLYSSGKDSTYAMHLMQLQNYALMCLITLRSKNPASYMFHTPAIDLVPQQAELLGIPLLLEETAGEEGYELQDLERALLRAKDQYLIEGIVTGALYSNYQRERVEMIADRVGLKVFSPLWHIDQEREMREILKAGFKIVFSAVASDGLDGSWLGREITDLDVDALVRLNERLGINVAGEGGEFESLVLGGPNFNGKIIIEAFEVVAEEAGVARMIVERMGVDQNA